MNTQWLYSTWRRSFWVLTITAIAMLALPTQVGAMSQGGIVALTNNERAKNGLAPLAANAKLNASAQAKAQDMVAKGYFAHTGPDGSSAWTFIRNAGYVYVAIGENLANGYSSDSSVVAGWMGSPGHRANILNSAFRDVGIGIAGNIVVAHFGSTTSAPAAAPAPAPKPPAPKPTAQPPAPSKTAPASRAISSPVADQPAVPAVAAPQPVQEQPKPNPRKTLIADLLKLIQYQEPELVTNG